MLNVKLHDGIHISLPADRWNLLCAKAFDARDALLVETLPTCSTCITITAMTSGYVQDPAQLAGVRHG